jgi:hypothetical protein
MSPSISSTEDDASVYGFATDGLTYIYLTITLEGVIMKSKMFDIMQEEVCQLYWVA